MEDQMINQVANQMEAGLAEQIRFYLKLDRKFQMRTSMALLCIHYLRSRTISGGYRYYDLRSFCGL